MTTQENINEEQVFSYFLSEMEGLGDPELRSKILKDSKALSVLHGFEKLHHQLGEMRFQTLSPGGEATHLDTDIPGQIANFKVLGKIGAGGMGEVYKAFDASLNRVLAIKLIKNSKGDHQLEQRFKLEAQAVAKMSHPGIVAVYSLGNDEDQGAYIAMEYLKGNNLRQEVKEKGPLDPEDVLEIARRLVEALGHAHERGILHRDIKPDNLLREEDTGIVKITDFGLAKFLDTDSNLTVTGMVFGTKNYMPPERLRDDGFDERSDIYSLGITLLELLTGEQPYRGKDSSELMQKIKRGDYVSTLLKERKWQPWKDLLKCLEKSTAADPKKRYASCADFLAALPTMQARGTSPMISNDAAPQFSWQAWVAIGLGLFLLIMVFFGRYGFDTPHETPQHGPAIESTTITPHTPQTDTPKSTEDEKPKYTYENHSRTWTVSKRMFNEIPVEVQQYVSEKIRDAALPEDHVWISYKEARGRIGLILKTKGADILAEVRISHPQFKHQYFEHRQRMELSVSSFANTLTDKIRENIKKNFELPRMKFKKSQWNDATKETKE